MVLSYTGLFLFALLFIGGGFIWSRIRRIEAEDTTDWMDWDTEDWDVILKEDQPAAQKAVVTPPVAEFLEPRPSKMERWCNRKMAEAGDAVCVLMFHFTNAVNGSQYALHFPTVTAFNRFNWIAMEHFLAESPEGYDDDRGWETAIRKFADNLTMSFLVTKQLPDQNKLEALARDAWTEGCAPRG